jgi:hypothetical protein
MGRGALSLSEKREGKGLTRRSASLICCPGIRENSWKKAPFGLATRRLEGRERVEQRAPFGLAARRLEEKKIVEGMAAGGSGGGEREKGKVNRY